MPQQIDWSKYPGMSSEVPVETPDSGIDFSGYPTPEPESQENQPGLLRRSWDWLSSPVSALQPFIDRQANKVVSLSGADPESEYGQNLRRLTEENMGGFVSPMSFIGEAAAGIGGIVGGYRALKNVGKLGKVAGEASETASDVTQLIRPGTTKPRLRINSDGSFSPADMSTLKYSKEGKLISEESNPAIKSAIESNDPDIQRAAEEVIKTRPNLASAARATYDYIGTSGWKQLENMGESGKEISRLMRRTRAEGASVGGTIISNNRGPLEKLSSKQFEEAVNVMEGITTSDSVQINEAASAIKSMLGEANNIAAQAGIRTESLTGKSVPFSNKVTFPQKFKSADSIIKTLVNQGMNVDEATITAKRIIKGKVTLKDVKKLNLQDYLKTKGALYEHVTDLATAATEHSVYGKNRNLLNSLTKQTSDPEKANSIIQSQLGLVSKDPALQKTANAVNTFEATVKLPLFAISNMNQAAATGMRTSTKSFINGLTETLKNVRSAEETGALQTTAQNILRETGQNPVTRLASRGFGWQKSEEFLRSWSANAGKSQADELFVSLKKNPNNKTARAQLDDLLLEDVNKVLAQDSLTPKQKNIAGFRMSELTQGLVDPADLPPMWSGNPLMKIPLMFKRFAFQQNKILVDAWKSQKTAADKAKFLGKTLALYTTMGEATGDVKKSITGAIEGKNPVESIIERGDGVDRLLSNISNAYALGLVGEILGQAGSGSTDRILKFMAGPAISDLVNVTAAAGSGNKERLGKELIRLTPLGYATSKQVFPNQNQPGMKPIMGGS